MLDGYSTTRAGTVGLLLSIRQFTTSGFPGRHLNRDRVQLEAEKTKILK
jgi:hypothetical protein